MTDIVTIEAGSASVTSSPELPQFMRRFGKYTLIYRFAAGGMANMYLGRLIGADGFERLVAVKVIHEHLTGDTDFRRMFVDEARLVSRISHPNVVQIIDLGKVGPSYFIAMEYVEGESVSALLRRNKPPFEVCARIAADAAAGLHAAHELRDQNGELFNVVHRDVSPHNILVGYNGAVKVVDFGVAHARGALHTSRQGSLKGKFGYMAPEQVQPGPAVDRRADIFALGVVLWEMTVHRRLFKAPTETETLGLVAACEVTPPSNMVSDYPQRLEQIVMRALQRDPADRYPTAEAMQEDLERYIASSGEPVLAGRVSQLMKQVFADRVDRKRRLIDKATQVPEDDEASVPEVDLLSSLSDRLQGLETAVRRRRAIGIAVVVGIVAIGGAVAALLALRSEPEPPTAAGPPARASSATNQPTGKTSPPEPRKRERAAESAAAPEEIKVTVVAAPESATLSVSGEAVANPYVYTGPPRPGRTEVVASAPGYVTKRLEVELTESGRWVMDLSRETPEAKEATLDERRRRKKRRSKISRPEGGGALDDKDVLANPYGD